jgi:CDP-diacylglycerol--glycerol-3-phosphate 3-phosphatidyltransferase
MAIEKRIWTIPNALSLLRLLLLIPILICLSKGQRIWALGLIVIGVISDFLDGILARRLNQKSDLGRIMDPVIDKINVLAVTFFMVVNDHYAFPLWFFLILMVRELTLLIGGSIMIRDKDTVMESNRPGKNSAFANGIVVIFYMMGWHPYAEILLYIALIMTIYSTWIYLKLFLKQKET